MTEEETPISVQIMGSEYRVACPPDEQDALLAAAEYLNDTMQGIRNTGKVVGVERIAVMAALNISYELLTTRQHGSQLETIVNKQLKLVTRKTDSIMNVLQQRNSA